MGFDELAKQRGIVDGLFGAAKSAITSVAQVGSKAIGTASGLVKDIAYGKDGKSGLMGENGLSNDILNSAGDVANKMLDTANSVGNSILGSKGSESGSVLDAAKGIANSMIDCVSDVGSSLIDAIGNTASKASDMAGDAAKGLADFASSAWDAATDMAGGLFDSVNDMLGLADEEVEDAIDDVADEVEDMMDYTEEDLEDFFDEEEENLEDLWGEEEEMEDEWDEDEWDEDWEDWEDEEDWENEDWEDPKWNWENEESDEPEDPYYGDNEPPFDEPVEETQSNQTSSQTASASTSSSATKKESEKKPSEPTTTPMGNDSPGETGNIVPASENKVQIGWKGVATEVVTGLIAMMHDGDQQLFNPYGPQTGDWTMYSFRPEDAKKTWPQIAITPSSFEAIRSMKDMLNEMPYVVVKEYFFKNTASTMIDFVKKIAGSSKEAKDDAQADTTVNEKSSKETTDVKSTGSSFMDKVKEIFHNIPLKPMVIDIPYILYFCLRQKVYGNTYIFPYIVQSGSTIIN